jgi:hypothetical protein
MAWHRQRKMRSVTASGFAVAMCAFLAVSCSDKAGGSSGTGGRGAAGSVDAKNGGGGGATSGVTQGTGGGTVLGGTGGAAQGTGGAIGNGTGGVARGSAGSLGVGTGGAAGGASGTGGMIADAGSDAIACSRGATLADCQLCQADVPASCERACPKVDCSVYPPPAECEPICAGGTCCECQRSFGNEYFWRSPQVPIKCGTSCTDMLSRWKTVVSQPSLTVCTVDSDCAAVGGAGTCGCAPSLSGCGKAVNRAAYQASDGPTIESTFRQSCTNPFLICDCGPAYVGCSAGQCVITGLGCCMGCFDAGRSGG